MRLNGPAVARLMLPDGKSERIEFDDELPRFGVRLRAGGKRTWIVQYRIGRAQRRMTIGSVAAVTAEAARKAAKKTLAMVDLGDDPQAEKDSRRSAVTLGALANDYLAYLDGLVERGTRRARSVEETRRHLTKHWAPLKRLAAHEVQKRDVAARLSDITNDSGPVAANRARSSLSAMYGWAIERGRVESNPVIGTQKEEEGERDRVLNDAELVAIWKECGDDDYGHIVRLLMLTGQRREEIGGMLDAELDLERRLWTIPGARTKNKRTHEVPLSDTAIEILRDVPRREGRGLLFGQGEGPFSGWSDAKAALDERVANSGSNVEPWTLHDLRRTVDTRMNESPEDGGLGVAPHIVDAVLNHVTERKKGVRGRYNHATYRSEKRQALDRWAVHVSAIVAGKQDEIDRARTARGGWTREQLDRWGVPWPPPKGWRRRLLSRSGPQASPPVCGGRGDAGHAEDYDDGFLRAALRRLECS